MSAPGAATSWKLLAPHEASDPFGSSKTAQARIPPFARTILRIDRVAKPLSRPAHPKVPRMAISPHGGAKLEQMASTWWTNRFTLAPVPAGDVNHFPRPVSPACTQGESHEPLCIERGHPAGARHHCCCRKSLERSVNRRHGRVIVEGSAARAPRAAVATTPMRPSPSFRLRQRLRPCRFREKTCGFRG